MSAFKKEVRYLVFKLKNLTTEQQQRLYQLQMELGPWNDIGECVVVESDWPNYQDVWQDIQAITEGQFVPKDDLKRHNAELCAQVEVWKREYISEVRKHVELHNRVYSGEFGVMPEGRIYSATSLVDDAVQVIESEIGENKHLRQIQADAVLDAIKSSVVVECFGTKCISVVGLVQYANRIKAGGL